MNSPMCWTQFRNCKVVCAEKHDLGTTVYHQYQILRPPYAGSLSKWLYAFAGVWAWT